MKRFGLIGHPIAHSLSPALFKAGYDGKYPYELIETADFDEAYIRFLNGYEGINVTAPFKELAYARADILSDECRIIKATNLLIRTPEGIKAYNSDYLGVRMWLQEVEERVARFSLPLPHPVSTNVLIIGLGGAGKAAAVAAASLGMDLILMNRSMEKAEAVAESISQMQDAPYAEVRPMEDFRECFRDADIIIYNIPSAVPALSELTAEDFGTGNHKFIMEANYKDPSFSNELIMKMKQKNPQASYTSGKVWLLYQALTGHEIFTGERPDLTRMTAVI
jgi:shikimate dehydrogenase